MKRVMRPFYWVLAILPVAALLIAMVPRTVNAATSMTGNDITVASSQVIHDDLYAGGRNVTVNGTVTGNLITGGSTVIVNGTVGGSILGAGGTITVNGTVRGSIIVAAGTLDIVGTVARDVSVVGGTVHVFAGSSVGRDVQAAAGTTIVQSKIGRDLNASSATIDLRPGAVIGRDLLYRGDTRPAVPAGVTVVGQIRHESGDTFGGWAAPTMPGLGGSGFAGWLRGLVGLLALGLILVWLVPGFTRRSATTLLSRPFGSLGWGVVSLLVTPIVAALIFGLGLLIGGWWLGLIVLVLWMVALVVAATIAAFTVVFWAAPRAGEPLPLWGAMAAGVLLLMVLSVVPWVGWLLIMIGGVAALGSMTMNIFQRPAAPVSSPPFLDMPVVDGSTPTPRVPTSVG